MVETVQFSPTPKSVKDVEKFLGMTGWYYRFILHYADHSAPLNALKRKDVPEGFRGLEGGRNKSTSGPLL